MTSSKVAASVSASRSPLEHLDRGHVGRRSRFSAEEAVKPLLDSAAHRTDVVRPAQQRVTGGLEEVARVAVGNRCEDRRAGCKVFVGLSGDNAGAPSRVEIVHRQEEEVGAKPFRGAAGSRGS